MNPQPGPRERERQPPVNDNGCEATIESAIHDGASLARDSRQHRIEHRNLVPRQRYCLNDVRDTSCPHLVDVPTDHPLVSNKLPGEETFAIVTPTNSIQQPGKSALIVL